MNAEQVKSSLVNQLDAIQTKEEKEFALNLIKDYLDKMNKPKELLLLRTRTNAGEPTYISILKNNKDYSNYTFAKEILTFLLEDEYLKEFGDLKLIEQSFNYLELWFNDKLFILTDAKDFVIEL